MQQTDSVDYININLLKWIKIMQMQQFTLTFEVHCKLTAAVLPHIFWSNDGAFPSGVICFVRF